MFANPVFITPGIYSPPNKTLVTTSPPKFEDAYSYINNKKENPMRNRNQDK